MTAKRALVVDDSKSARIFLSGLLEQHSLEVDAAETAEQAIDYLTRHRPDVIFMDHMMPGMDGFQAVQAIKSNPRTATIPILMYTSQEGELYVGQARALGAMGVLPKQVAPADVSKVLQQLHLTDMQPMDLQDIPAAAALASSALASSEMVPTATVAHFPAIATVPAPGDVLLRDQIAELRRFMVTSLDQQSERILEDVRRLVHDSRPPVPAEPATTEPPRVTAAVDAGARGEPGCRRAGVCCCGARDVQRDRAIAQLASTAETASIAVTAPEVAQVKAVAVWTASRPSPWCRFPSARRRWGEGASPNSTDLVQSISRQGLKGTVEVRRHAGRYCLMGSGADGYSLAEAGVPYLQCDLVADAGDPVLGAAAPESVEFATALARLRRQHGDAIRISVTTGTESELQQAYPEIGGDPPRVPTAGEWNAAAEANNRVELRWHPT